MTKEMNAEEIIRDFCPHSSCAGKGTYTVKAVCTNCDWKGTVELIKGHEFSRWRACPNCGCTYTLMRRSS
jgi:predicted RNA-binding Zn ribbon-like protein